MLEGRLESKENNLSAIKRIGAEPFQLQPTDAEIQRMPKVSGNPSMMSAPTRP